MIQYTKVVLRNSIYLLTCFIATPPDRRWQRNEGVLLLHSFLSLDILVAFSIQFYLQFINSGVLFLGLYSILEAMVALQFLCSESMHVFA